MLGNQLVLWYSRRQDVVTLSSTESEYLALGEAAKDALWMGELMEEIGITMEKPPIIITDSRGGMNLSKNNAYHRRTRHINHRHYSLREKIAYGDLAVRWILGKENPADILTKILPMSGIRRWQHEWMNCLTNLSPTQ